MDLNDIQTVGVIGAGEMGHGIAEIVALSGYNVYLNDIKEDLLKKALKRISSSLDKLVSKGKISNEQKIESLNRINITINLEKVARNSQLIIEAVPEIMEIKKEVFKKLDQFLPENGIIASNTSNMRITELSSVTNRQEKFIGLHFFNPVVIMKTVEIIKGEKTSDEIMNLMSNFIRSLNKIPIKVLKDTPGFIVNRVQAPVMILAGKLLDLKIDEPGNIDIALKKMGLPMGIYELNDFVGLDVMYHSMEYFKKTLSPDYEPPNWLKEKIKLNELGMKTGKGIYDWSKGRPDLSKYKPSDKIKIEDLIAIQVNEASKLLEEGVVNKSRIIDKAIINGTGNKMGVIAPAKGFGIDKMVQRCEYLSKKFNVETFKPTELLKAGKL